MKSINMIKLNEIMNKSNLLFLASGVLIGIGFVFPLLWVLGFLGVACFIVAVDRSSSFLSAVLGGLIAWTTKSLIVMSWVWTTYPIYWVDLGLGVAEIPVIGFYWFTIAIFLGVAGIFCASLLWLSKSYLHKNLRTLLFPLLWVGAEILGALSLSFFTLGAGGTINTVFSFGSVGYLLAEHHWLLQLAAFGGVYALSFTFVLASTMLWSWLNVQSFKQSPLIITGLVLLCLMLSGTVLRWPSHADTGLVKTTVAIVDTELGGKDYFDKGDREEYRAKQIEEAFTFALQAGTDYIVMSEDSRVGDPSLALDKAYANFQSKYSDPEVITVEAGSVPLLYGDMALRASIYDGIEKTSYAVDKQYLVPQGEFMPYFYIATLDLLGVDQAAKIIKEKLPFKPGPLYSQAKLPKNIPGVLFCFASADPLAVKKLASERELPFIAHPISHAWFNNPTVMWHQFDAMLKIHAVWNQLPIVSAGNMVHGALFTRSGEKVSGDLAGEGERWRVSTVSF